MHRILRLSSPPGVLNSIRHRGQVENEWNVMIRWRHVRKIPHRHRLWHGFGTARWNTGQNPAAGLAPSVFRCAIRGETRSAAKRSGRGCRRKARSRQNPPQGIRESSIPERDRPGKIGRPAATGALRPPLSVSAGRGQFLAGSGFCGAEGAAADDDRRTAFDTRQ